LRFKIFERFKQGQSFTAKAAKEAQEDAKKTSTEDPYGDQRDEFI